MTETHSLYQFLALCETAHQAGHRTQADTYPEQHAIGWTDFDTCVSLTIP
jgi:hypothetical protein